MIIGLCMCVDGEGGKGKGEEKEEGRKAGKGRKGGRGRRGGREGRKERFITECKSKACTVSFTLFPEVPLSVL